jgi:2-dehydropantoate 2-reductase
MRFIVVGAGAVGGLIGGRLIGAGQEVIFVARGAHADAIERGGLTVEAPSGAKTYRPSALWRPGTGELRAGDMVLLAVKSQDTREALAALSGEPFDSVAIACVQNGVTNEEEAARRFAAVYGVMIWTPAVHLEPGKVASYAERDALLRVGRWPEGEDDRARELAAALAGAGLEAESVADVARYKRAKLLTNLVNALDAFIAPGGRADLFRALVGEGVAAMTAAGLPFIPPGEFTQYAMERLPEVKLDGRDRPGGSTWQSLARGIRSSEIAYFNGYVVELGAAHGVATPYNRALVELAGEFERGERALRSVSADELRARAGG